MSLPTCETARVRYYLDDCKTNPAMSLPVFSQVMKKLLCRWIRLNYHLKDFITAVDHEASLIYIDYIAIPGLETPALPVDDALAYCPAVPPARTFSEPPARFYDADSTLAHGVHLEGRKALASIFWYGISKGWHARDFIAMARDEAASAVYDYDVRLSLGGLGGCGSAEQYLAAFD